MKWEQGISYKKIKKKSASRSLVRNSGLAIGQPTSSTPNISGISLSSFVLAGHNSGLAERPRGMRRLGHQLVHCCGCSKSNLCNKLCILRTIDFQLMVTSKFPTIMDAPMKHHFLPQNFEYPYFLPILTTKQAPNLVSQNGTQSNIRSSV